MSRGFQKTFEEVFGWLKWYGVLCITGSALKVKKRKKKKKIFIPYSRTILFLGGGLGIYLIEETE